MHLQSLCTEKITFFLKLKLSEFFDKNKFTLKFKMAAEATRPEDLDDQWYSLTIRKEIIVWNQFNLKSTPSNKSNTTVGKTPD